MNASGNLKRPVSVERLMGKKKSQQKQLSPEEKKKELDRLKQIFGKE
jgi:hypothetical protein